MINRRIKTLWFCLKFIHICVIFFNFLLLWLIHLTLCVTVEHGKLGIGHFAGDAVFVIYNNNELGLVLIPVGCHERNLLGLEPDEDQVLATRDQ